MTKRQGLMAVLAAGAIGLAACGSDEPVRAGDAESAEQATSDEVETGSGNAEDEPAEDGNATDADVADLDFTGTTLEGAQFDGAALAGKPAVLWFWAPWCPTCRAQAPAVSALAKTYDGEVNVVGVGGAAATSEIEGVAKDIDGPTHLIDEPGAIWQHFKITAQSTYVVLDADGRIVTDGTFLSDDDLRSTVADLVG